jgi:hypothetical protein
MIVAAIETVIGLVSQWNLRCSRFRCGDSGLGFVLQGESQAFPGGNSARGRCHGEKGIWVVLMSYATITSHRSCPNQLEQQQVSLYREVE